ncbi:MAG: glycosyltransferase family 2 protein [Betaproteobacteria bacterium]|jgi:glycosyltransferase involved in cell wall biosynthesis|nr:glycosyltransferase family 2 protein [Betaproteobacteria bacterium]
MRLSVVIIAFNESANIGACLDSVEFADERIVMDNGSTDGTQDIVLASGARLAKTIDWPGFGPQKNRVLALATGDWVLSLDADERVTPALQAEIEEAMRNADRAAYTLPRLSSFCGVPIRHGGWYPDRVLRLFPRGLGRFSDDLVHEKILTDLQVRGLRSNLLHESFRSFESVLDKVNRYSTASAAGMLAKGRKGSFSVAIGHGAWAFIRTYIVKRGFLDGRMGLAVAISSAEGSYYRYLKLWLAQQTK